MQRYLHSFVQASLNTVLYVAQRACNVCHIHVTLNWSESTYQLSTDFHYYQRCW